MTNLADGNSAALHPFDLEREVNRATAHTLALRSMGLSEAEIAVRTEPSREWTTEHPGPGMRRCLIQWPWRAGLEEVSISVDNSFEWDQAKIVFFRREAA